MTACCEAQLDRVGRTVVMEGRVVRNSEDRGSDAIDQLVDEQLSRERSRYTDVGQDFCTLCGGEWHGEPIEGVGALAGGQMPGCPGAFATDHQCDQWLDWQNHMVQRALAWAPILRRSVSPGPSELHDDPLTDPLPSEFCELCGGEWHEGRVSDWTVWDAGHIPACPGASASAEQRERWLWQCSFRRYCDAIADAELGNCLLEVELSCCLLEQADSLIDSLPCGGG